MVSISYDPLYLKLFPPTNKSVLVMLSSMGMWKSGEGNLLLAYYPVDTNWNQVIQISPK